MKSSTLLLLFSTLCAARATAATDPIVDKLVERDFAGRHFVSFCSRGGGLIGHAFILLTSDDEEQKACKIDAALGFWPDADKEKKRMLAVFRPLPGRLVDEIKRYGVPANSECRLTVPLSEKEYEILKIKMGKFAEKNYELLGNDCITFCEEVGRDVLRLRMPKRDELFTEFKREIGDAIAKRGNGLNADKVVIEQFPVRYVRNLAELNGRNR